MASTLLWLVLAAFTGDSSCTILHFTARWCEPCRQMLPALNQLRQQGWDIRAVDTDRQRQTAAQYGVQNLPTLVILSGGREVDRIVGMASPSQIEKRLTRAAARSGTSQGSNTQSGSARTAPGYVSGGRTQAANTSPVQFARSTANSGPIVRGQSPGMPALPRAVSNTFAAAQSMVAGAAPKLAIGGSHPTPKLNLQQAINRASRATVRIRVDEGNTLAFGTGTIIDVRGDEALVLTCGHLFRDMQAGTQLAVELFVGTSQETSVPAELIDFSADDVDIGLISMRIPVMVEPVDILPRGEQLHVDQAVFSFGCDHGANPSRRDTQISRINRYIGAANVEILGAPAVGRSGGGLFDEQGRLVGVCNAANADDDEGIYAAAEVVYSQLERLELTELFEPSADSLIASDDLPAGPTTSPDIRPISLHNGPQRPARQADNPALWPDEALQVSGMQQRQPAVAATAGDATKIICIVRDAQGNDRMVEINSPSNELLQHIQQDARQ